MHKIYQYNKVKQFIQKILKKKILMINLNKKIKNYKLIDYLMI